MVKGSAKSKAGQGTECFGDKVFKGSYLKICLNNRFVLCDGTRWDRYGRGAASDRGQSDMHLNAPR